ncbi:hypothetical protein K2173_016066 [Erythroxylum novogranatense]|uniref:YGGT family protein n=1 Tax=Erythroxylum novogranatense TaxID=1862640 RepID=A0AAV8SG26_9ROSI|nr:hypothetical protein K2173_016066 [Erythroxylum novogranatense]
MALNKSPSQKLESSSVVTNFVLLSSSIVQNPLSFRPVKPNLGSAATIVRELHSSITSIADKCFRFLHLIASENPFFKKILSFSCHFSEQLTHIHRISHRNSHALSNHSFAAILPGDSVAGVVVANGILNFLNIYNTLLVIRLVLTWFPNSPPAIVNPLSTVCDPYLNIFRGIIPPLGGTLDLSPILAFIVLNAFTSTAAALPAELPVPGAPVERHAPHSVFNSLTTTQKKWMRRICRNSSKSSKNAD